MKKTTEELLQEYEAQCSDNAENAQSKAFCCSSDQSWECCQLCSCLACIIMKSI